jgi:hypothetical protein
VGAENSVTPCDLQILVDETTEAISSQWPNGRCGVGECGGRAGADRAIGAGGERCNARGIPAAPRRGAASGDREVVEVFAAEGVDPAFCSGVRSWCPNRDAGDPGVGGGEYRVGGGGELGISVADQEPNRVAWSPRSMSRLRACWVIQALVGVGGDPGDLDAGGAVLDQTSA